MPPRPGSPSAGLIYLGRSAGSLQQCGSLPARTGTATATCARRGPGEEFLLIPVRGLVFCRRRYMPCGCCRLARRPGRPFTPCTPGPGPVVAWFLLRCSCCWLARRGDAL